nr:MAG TPA: tail protein [Caudoviricetes sp.]
MSVNQAVNLNLSTDIVPPVLKMVQNDSNSRYIVASLWDGASAYDVGSASVMLRFAKPDGTGGMYDADEAGNAVSVDGNVVTIPVATQVLTVAGDVFAQVDIYGSSNSKLASFAFKIDVAASVYPDAQLISSDYYNVLTATIANAVTAAQNAAASATAAAQSAVEAATSVEGAVKYNTPQALTEEQKQQVRDNINAPAPYTAGEGIAISGSVISAKARPWNRNLLDNWYFGNPVNQRGKTVYSGAGYGIDRWKADAVTPNVTTIKDGYIELSQNALIEQILEEPYSLCGKQVTISALTTTGLYFSTVTVPSKAELSAVTADTNLGNAHFVVNGNDVGYIDLLHTKAHNTMLRLRAFEGYTVGVIAVGLELGPQQTLAHQENGAWVLNELPDYGEELIKCMRYLQIISTPYDTSGNGVAIGYANNTADLWVPIPLAVPMRRSPTPTVPTGGASLFKVGKTSSALKDITKITGGWAMLTGMACAMRSLIFTASGLTAGETYALFMQQGAQIILSSEL